MHTSTVVNIIEEGLCIGCGLCASVFPNNIDMQVSNSGHLRPIEKSPLDASQTLHLESFCPGVVVSGMPENKIPAPEKVDFSWGSIKNIITGHATDPVVRHKAATGGALTAICQHLLESEQVDAVLQVAGGGLKAYFGHSQLSKTTGDVLQACGSIYASTSPLEGLIHILETGIKIALVAKPCDISAVRLLSKKERRIDEQVKLMLSPICGGFFPPFSMDNFLRSVDADEQDVESVSYRGEGCPGPTTIRFKNGETISKTYLDFWGTDSSQWHMPWRCRICPDGSGEAADIVAGDTWPNCEPTEEMMEGDLGTNVIISRTDRGSEAVHAAIESGHLNCVSQSHAKDLDSWQPHLLRKKITAEARFAGMRATGQSGLSTIDLRTDMLKVQMESNDFEAEKQGTARRIQIGKHSDDFVE